MFYYFDFVDEIGVMFVRVVSGMFSAYTLPVAFLSLHRIQGMARDERASAHVAQEAPLRRHWRWRDCWRKLRWQQPKGDLAK